MLTSTNHNPITLPPHPPPQQRHPPPHLHSLTLQPNPIPLLNLRQIRHTQRPTKPIRIPEPGLRERQKKIRHSVIVEQSLRGAVERVARVEVLVDDGEAPGGGGVEGATWDAAGAGGEELDLFTPGHVEAGGFVGAGLGTCY